MPHGIRRGRAPAGASGKRIVTIESGRDRLVISMSAAALDPAYRRAASDVPVTAAYAGS